MALTYDDVYTFMTDYFTAYNEKGQFVETQSILDNYYAETIYFDDEHPTSRSDWYESIARHPAVQDHLTLDRLFFDEEHQDCACIVHTQAIERATGNVLVDLHFIAHYRFSVTGDKDIRITHVLIYLEPNPMKQAALAKAYNILPGK